MNSTQAISLANSLAHTFSQLVALPVGAATDWAFNTAYDYAQNSVARSLGGTGDLAHRIESPLDAIREGIEFAAQIMFNGMVVALVVNYLASLRVEVSDPNGGSLFIVLLFASQPKLRSRIERLVNYVQRTWMRTESALAKKTRGWQQKANSELADRGELNKATGAKIAQRAGSVAFTNRQRGVYMEQF